MLLFAADGSAEYDATVDAYRRKSRDYATVMTGLYSQVSVDDVYDDALDRRVTRAAENIRAGGIVIHSVMETVGDHASSLVLAMHLLNQDWLVSSQCLYAPKDDPTEPVAFGGLFGRMGPAASRMVRVFRHHAVPILYSDGTKGAALVMASPVFHRSEAGDHNVEAFVTGGNEVTFRAVKPIDRGSEVVVSYAAMSSTRVPLPGPGLTLGPIDSPRMLLLQLMCIPMRFVGRSAVHSGEEDPVQRWLHRVMDVLSAHGPLPVDPTEACRQCGTSPAVHACGRCMTSMYCSRECQKLHWKKHHKAEHCCRLMLLVKYLSCSRVL
jgi:hypothetical protein